MREDLSDTALSDLLLRGLGQLAQGVAIFDDRLQLAAWNDRFAEIGAWPPGLLKRGVAWSEVLRVAAERGDFGPGHALRQVADRLARADGGEPELMLIAGRAVERTVAALPGGGLAVTYVDTTARRGAEARLQQLVTERTRALQLSEARLKLIADEVPAGIAHLDRDMRFLYTNKRFAAAYGRKPEEVIGLPAKALLHPRTLSESEHFFEQARRGALVDFEMRLELPGGRMKDIRTLLRPETPSSGEVIGFYLLSIDVTRRKATMSALMGAQKMDALGRMASGISHDFNNLLTIILGNLVPLTEELGEGELVTEYVAPAISAARRGSALTQRLLTLARREQFAPEPTDIVGAVAEICALLRSSMPRTLRIVQRNQRDVPAAQVDRAQLEMALLNLAMNARDATEGKGEIVIEVAPYRLSPGEADLLRLPAGPYVSIKVSDDGCGMSPDQTERVFEPFYTTKTAGAGSGLGLSMVYGFVQQSNGAISVDTAPGRGASFTILLPGGDLRGAGASGPEPQSAATRAAEGHLPLVLLVEDDRDVRRTIRRRLAGLGYPLIEADDASEALTLLARVEAIGLVLSDIDMPGAMDGMALARHISDRCPGVGVLLMSGKASLAAQCRADLPDVPILRKPFTDSQLSEALIQARGPRRIRPAS